jgi:hypothetical protein
LPESKAFLEGFLLIIQAYNSILSNLQEGRSAGI